VFLPNLKEIETEGSRWSVIEKARLHMGSYLLLILEVTGARVCRLTLRIRYQTLQARSDSTFVEDAIRSCLKNPNRDTDVWL
jgi:hypothetical protein